MSDTGVFFLSLCIFPVIPTRFKPAFCALMLLCLFLAGSDYGLPNGTVANHLESYPHSSDHPPRSSSHSEEEMKMGQAVIKDSIDLLIKMANSCESAYMARSPLVHSVATTAWSGLRVRQPNNASSVFKV